MKRQEYLGYVIDKDNLGRVYIYNKKSPYSEESDKIIIGKGVSLAEVKDRIFYESLMNGHIK